jgi:two-component system chemotaxis response regulator CheY
VLTGLPNRRWLLERLGRELDRQHRNTAPLTVAYIDLDGFKGVNDLHGHAEGDRCLSLVAEALKLALRPGDVVARMGGDEFVVLLPSTAQAAANLVLGRLRAAIERVGARRSWRLGASAGAVVVPARAYVRTDEVLGAADALMYRMKRTDGDHQAVEPLVGLDQLGWSD